MLGSEERAILDFERSWWLTGGAKDRLIESVLGLTADLYYDHLLRLLDRPEASTYDPLTVRRVRALLEPPMAGEVAVG
jgi:hypothetical protein